MRSFHVERQTKLALVTNTSLGKCVTSHEYKVLCTAFLQYTLDSSHLVDPASSHMLVSKIKPCMSKYKQVCTVKLRMAH